MMEKRSRSWTDDDIRAALPKVKSWSGLLTELGLCATSAGSKRAVKRRIAELELSTEHFCRNRTWTDQILRKVVPECSTWPELLRSLGLTSTSNNSRAAVRARCLKLGISIDHLFDFAAPKQKLPTPSLPINLNQLRYAAPAIATAWFFMRGCMVSIPAEQAPYDLLVETPRDGVKKVQVKTGTRRDRYGSFQVGIAPNRNHGPNRYICVPYDPSDVDLFFIVTADGTVYLIPMAAVAGLVSLSLNAYRHYDCGSAGGLMSVSSTADLGLSAWAA